MSHFLLRILRAPIIPGLRRCLKLLELPFLNRNEPYSCTSRFLGGLRYMDVAVCKFIQLFALICPANLLIAIACLCCKEHSLGTKRPVSIGQKFATHPFSGCASRYESLSVSWHCHVALVCTRRKQVPALLSKVERLCRSLRLWILLVYVLRKRVVLSALTSIIVSVSRLAHRIHSLM